MRSQEAPEVKHLQAAQNLLGSKELSKVEILTGDWPKDFPDFVENPKFLGIKVKWDFTRTFDSKQNTFHKVRPFYHPKVSFPEAKFLYAIYTQSICDFRWKGNFMVLCDSVYMDRLRFEELIYLFGDFSADLALCCKRVVFTNDPNAFRGQTCTATLTLYREISYEYRTVQNAKSSTRVTVDDFTAKEQAKAPYFAL